MVPAGSPDRPPLSPLAREVLDRVIDATVPGEGIARENAVALLVEEGIERADAVDVLDQLQDRGYVYIVDDTLFVTDRDGHK